MDYYKTYKVSSMYCNAYGLNSCKQEYIQYHKHYTVNGFLNIYTLDSKFHHETKPAISEYIENILIRESYYIQGMRHNYRGAAIINNDINGELLSTYYYVNDTLKNIMNHKVIIYN